MLPTSAVQWPPARSRCASNAVVVLLPLVPVTHTVRACGWAANQSAVPPMKRVPCAAAASASGPYGLIPGDLTTTSNADSACASTRVQVCSSASPSAAASPASAWLQNRVSGRVGSAPRSQRQAARPSRPQPHSATALPSSCETCTQPLPQRHRHPVFAFDLQQRLDRQFARVELRQDLAGESRHQRILAPVRARGQRGHRRA